MRHVYLLACCLLLGTTTLLPAPALAQAPVTFAPVGSYSTGAGSLPTSVAVADVNGDGRPDLLTTNLLDDAVGVLLGMGAGTFGALATYSTGTGSSPDGLRVADVNLDGKPDVLTANSRSNEVGVLLGTGLGTFGPVSTYGTGLHPNGLAVADVNADGNPDVVTANYYGDTVGVLLGTGTGTFGLVSQFNAGSNSAPLRVVVADVNADGYLDVATANNNNSTVGVLLGTGTGSFGAATTYAIGAGNHLQGLAVADVNADGKPDLFTTNHSNSVFVLLGTGLGAFSAAAAYSVGAFIQPVGLVVADMNGDGRPDLLAGGYDGLAGVVGVLLGTGLGTFGAATTYPAGVGIGHVSLAVADVNGDGKPDVLAANQYAHTVSVLLNTTDATPLVATATALPGATATLAPNPARAAATLTTAGLPAGASQLAATLHDALGRELRRLTVPAAAGAARAEVPTAGLPWGPCPLSAWRWSRGGRNFAGCPIRRRRHPEASRGRVFSRRRHFEKFRGRVSSRRKHPGTSRNRVSSWWKYPGTFRGRVSSWRRHPGTSRGGKSGGGETPESSGVPSPSGNTNPES